MTEVRLTLSTNEHVILWLLVRRYIEERQAQLAMFSDPYRCFVPEEHMAHVKAVDDARELLAKIGTPTIPHDEVPG